jgi:hypothetical protein
MRKARIRGDVGGADRTGERCGDVVRLMRSPRVYPQTERLSVAGALLQIPVRQVGDEVGVVDFLRSLKNTGRRMVGDTRRTASRVPQSCPSNARRIADMPLDLDHRFLRQTALAEVLCVSEAGIGIAVTRRCPALETMVLSRSRAAANGMPFAEQRAPVSDVAQVPAVNRGIREETRDATRTCHRY